MVQTTVLPHHHHVLSMQVLALINSVLVSGGKKKNIIVTPLMPRPHKVWNFSFYDNLLAPPSPFWLNWLKGFVNSRNVVTFVLLCDWCTCLQIIILFVSVLSDATPQVKKIKLGTGQGSAGNKTHCKCLCQYNVTETELMDAIKELQKNRAMKMKENKN